MSRVRANSITNKNATGAPNFTHGAVITGVATATGFKATGIVTAASFQGDGSALTGIDATALKDSGGSVKVQANSSGAVVTGMLTATGVLTYEDVTNVDAIGIVTAREGVLVGAGKSVGIGTVTPRVPLEVHNTEATGTFINVKSKSNTIAGINFGDFEDDDIGSVRYGNGDNSLRFFANGSSEKFRVGSAGQWGIGGGNYGTAGQVLKSGGASAAPTWGSVTSKVLQVKFKESTSTRYNYNSGSWGKVDDSSSGIQEAITPSAVGNTILVQMYLSMSVSDGDYGGVTISVHDGSSYISMMGECGSGSYYAPSAILGDNSRFNEHVRNATGGTLWYPVMLQGRHLTTNTNSHTINLYVRMGNNDFYFGDNGAANNMIIWEIEGDIGN